MLLRRPAVLTLALLAGFASAARAGEPVRMGPLPAQPFVLYDASGKPVMLLFTVAAPGTYSVFLGDLAPQPSPNPNPNPNPGPIPPGPVPPNPTPDPNFPPGKFGLAQVAYDLGKLIPDSVGRAKIASALALSFRVEAGNVLSNQTTDPAKLLDLTRARNAEAVTALGAARESVMPFFSRLAEEVYKRAVTGAPANPAYAWSLADFATAWKEIADGLEKVK